MNFSHELTTATRKKRVLADIVETHRRYEDVVVPVRHFFRRPDTDESPLFVHGSLGPLCLSTTAEGQLLNRLNMPAAYIHRCPDVLQAENINYWLSKKPKMEVTVRMVLSENNWKIKQLQDEMVRITAKPETEEGDPERVATIKSEVNNLHNYRFEKLPNDVRAILSSTYSKIDDDKLYPFVFEALEKMQDEKKKEDMQIKTWESDWYFSLLRVLYYSLEAEHGKRIHWGGVSISNSETAGSAIWIKPMVRAGSMDAGNAYDYLDSSLAGSTRFIHRGEMNLDKIEEAVVRAHEAAQTGIARLIECGTIFVQKPAVEAEALVRNNDHLPTRLIQVLKDQYEKKLEATKLEIAESILEAVKDLPAFKKQLAEEVVGRYLNLFNDIEGRVAAVVSTGAV